MKKLLFKIITLSVGVLVSTFMIDVIGIEASVIERCIYGIVITIWLNQGEIPNENS